MNQTLNFVANGTTELYYGKIPVKPVSILKEAQLVGEGKRTN